MSVVSILNYFDEGDVLRAINKLKINCTCGPDGLFFKCLKRVITLPLIYINLQADAINFFCSYTLEEGNHLHQFTKGACLLCGPPP